MSYKWLKDIIQMSFKISVNLFSGFMGKDVEEQKSWKGMGNYSLIRGVINIGLALKRKGIHDRWVIW
jgi:hypothetical protein